MTYHFNATFRHPGMAFARTLPISSAKLYHLTFLIFGIYPKSRPIADARDICI